MTHSIRLFSYDLHHRRVFLSLSLPLPLPLRFLLFRLIPLIFFPNDNKFKHSSNIYSNLLYCSSVLVISLCFCFDFHQLCSSPAIFSLSSSSILSLFRSFFILFCFDLICCVGCFFCCYLSPSPPPVSIRNWYRNLRFVLMPYIWPNDI